MGRLERAAPLAELELLVMLAVIGLKDTGYPLSIRDAIESRTGRSVTRPAVFITLERLEDKGLLSSRYGDPTPVRGGRAKRYFTATRPGVAAVRQALETVSAMTRGLDSLLRES